MVLKTTGPYSLIDYLDAYALRETLEVSGGDGFSPENIASLSEAQIAAGVGWTRMWYRLRDNSTNIPNISYGRFACWVRSADLVPPRTFDDLLTETQRAIRAYYR